MVDSPEFFPSKLSTTLTRFRYAVAYSEVSESRLMKITSYFKYISKQLVSFEKHQVFQLNGLLNLSLTNLNQVLLSPGVPGPFLLNYDFIQTVFNQFFSDLSAYQKALAVQQLPTLTSLTDQRVKIREEATEKN